MILLYSFKALQVKIKANLLALLEQRLPKTFL